MCFVGFFNVLLQKAIDSCTIKLEGECTMINYPNGKTYIAKTNSVNQSTTKKSKAPSAPKGIKSTNTNTAPVNYANRGMSLEHDIEESNKYYLTNDIAVIHKKPVPIQIVDVDYPARSSAVIKRAYFKTPSELDFNGIYKGKYIDFDAKETKNKTSFPLQNFHEHQVTHMQRIVRQEGICFAIIRFTTIDETYLLDAQHIIRYWEDQSTGGRKSIPLAYIKEHGHIIRHGYIPRLDYIKVIEAQYNL